MPKDDFYRTLDEIFSFFINGKLSGRTTSPWTYVRITSLKVTIKVWKWKKWKYEIKLVCKFTKVGIFNKYFSIIFVQLFILRDTYTFTSPFSLKLSEIPVSILFHYLQICLPKVEPHLKSIQSKLISKTRIFYLKILISEFFLYFSWVFDLRFHLLIYVFTFFFLSKINLALFTNKSTNQNRHYFTKYSKINK